MAEGWGPSGAGAALDALAAGWTWFKLHVGAPGAAGTANPAVETTRKQVTWAATGSDGVYENSAAFSFTSIAGSEDATKFSTWSLVAAGTFGNSGSITANPYNAGDTLSFAIGAVTTAVTLAS